jgi:hypothetical protein
MVGVSWSLSVPCVSSQIGRIDIGRVVEVPDGGEDLFSGSGGDVLRTIQDARNGDRSDAGPLGDEF